MKKKNGQGPETSPALVFQREMIALRRDLRVTLRAYRARLESELAEVAAFAPKAGELSRERIHRLRDLTILLRNRKVRPEKGRRKDLRKLDTIIQDLRAATHPPASR